MCRRGWCDRNTDNYLECPECHVQFKDVTKADPEMHPLQALRFHADGTVEELPTYSNDDASRYEGPVYESCGYVLIPRLDVKEVVRDRDTPDIVVIHRRRPADDVRRTRPLLGRGEFSS